MKPKTIAPVLAAIYLAGIENGQGKSITDPKEILHRRESFYHSPAYKESVKLIQQLLEECAPEKQYKQDEAWRIAVNKTIDQYKSNIRSKLK